MTVPLLSLGLAALLAGCTAPPRSAEPTVFTFVESAGPGGEPLWQAAQDVLRAHRFKLDRVDRRAGAITTYPVTSQHCFEFWRHDVATAYDRMEASIRTVRRTVAIDFATPAAPESAAMTVTVRRERLAAPDRQYNRSFAALRMFSDTLPAADTGLPVSSADDYWIDDGRDPAMEKLLLDRIVACAGR